MTALIWLLLLVPLLLGLAVQGLVRSVFRRYGAIPNHSGVTGADAARALLDAHGLQRGRVEIIPGFLTDHYDGEAKALRLSEPVGRERSVAALGVAGHEVSHAYQDAEGDRTYRVRRSIGEQLAQFAPWSTFFLIAGFWFGVPLFIALSLVFVGGLVLFALATLPVGQPGDPVWILPQTQKPVLLWPGNDDTAGGPPVFRDPGDVVFHAKAPESEVPVPAVPQFASHHQRTGLIGRRDGIRVADRQDQTFGGSARWKPGGLSSPGSHARRNWSQAPGLSRRAVNSGLHGSGSRMIATSDQPGGAAAVRYLAHGRVPHHSVARRKRVAHPRPSHYAGGPVRMIEEHENFGLRGGQLKVDLSPVRTLAFELSLDSDRRWHHVEAQLYLELGLDAAEYHANWGIV